MVANRTSDISGNANDNTYTHATQQDRLYNSDMSMILAKEANPDKDLMVRGDKFKANASTWHGSQQIDSVSTPFKQGAYGELREGTDPSHDQIESFERHYDTPDSLIQKNSRMQEHQDMLDLELSVTKERKAFTRDDFRLMINMTYTEFYGKFRDQFNPDEYM